MSVGLIQEKNWSPSQDEAEEDAYREGDGNKAKRPY